MVVAALGIGFALMALPGGLRRLGRRIDPSRWAFACLVALVAGAATIGGTLMVVALPVVLDAVGEAAAAEECRQMFDITLPATPTAGWVALGVSTWLVTCGRRHWRRATRTQRATVVEPGIGEHRNLGRHELVVLPCAEMLAFSAPGHPGQVLISQGLTRQLDAAALDVIIHHEVAHLDARHALWLRAAASLDAMFAALPTVASSISSLRLALERWADEVAVRAGNGNRTRVSEALLHVTEMRLGADVAGFSSAETLAERVTALRHPPARLTWPERSLIAAPGLVLTTGLGITASRWLHCAHAFAGLWPL